MENQNIVTDEAIEKIFHRLGFCNITEIIEKNNVTIFVHDKINFFANSRKHYLKIQQKNELNLKKMILNNHLISN